MPRPIPLRRVDGPVMVLGGPYGKREATRAALAEAARLQISSDRIVCTGDVVAYGADPAATVALVRAAGGHVVRGNCEASIAAAPGCGCGFPAGSSCERLSAGWFAHAARELDEDARSWMAALAPRIDLKIAGARLAVIHGGVDVINRFVFASTAAATKRAEIERSGCDGVIGGHCGLPFTQAIDGRLWHNAGAVGLPANDGTRRTWCSILTAEAGGIAIEHRAIEYDWTAAAAGMRRAGLPQEYATALATGLWPSCDVLPLQEIRARGVPLVPERVFWSPPARDAVRKRRRASPRDDLWPRGERTAQPRLAPHKFRDPQLPAAGEPRAQVTMERLT